MKVAVIGSRSITEYPLKEIIPPETTEIIARAELVIALWDGKSTGTTFVINQCKKLGKPFILITNT